MNAELRAVLSHAVAVIFHCPADVFPFVDVSQNIYVRVIGRGLRDGSLEVQDIDAPSLFLLKGTLPNLSYGKRHAPHMFMHLEVSRDGRFWGHVQNGQRFDGTVDGSSVIFSDYAEGRRFRYEFHVSKHSLPSFPIANQFTDDAPESLPGGDRD